MRLTLTLLFGLLYLKSLSQTFMTPIEAFQIGLKVNKLSASDRVVYKRLTGLNPETFQWGEIFASYFDKENYLSAKNDEFQRVPYLTKKYKELNNGVETVDLHKVLSYTATLPFGVYNSQCNCFPIDKKDFTDANPYLLNVKSVGTFEFAFKNPIVRLSIGEFLNLSDITLNLPMSPEQGSSFINSKKDENGTIKRSVSIKVFYNAVSKKYDHSDLDYYIGAFIHKIEFYNNSNIIKTIYPNHDFYDKVNFIRLKNGTDTIYKKNGGVRTFNLTESSFYEIVNYSDGKPFGKVKVNYMSGKLYTEGTYNETTNTLKYEGKMTWFHENGLPSSEGIFVDGSYHGVVNVWYENGQKKIEANYSHGVYDGKYTSWHENGLKSKEFTYINGKKNGCSFEWDSNGKCMGNKEFMEEKYYGTYFENGESNTYSSNNKKCLCTNQKIINK
jgi:antitoxin component YwqK of YwqJK toxin-antitoxin module